MVTASTPTVGAVRCVPRYLHPLTVGSSFTLPISKAPFGNIVVIIQQCKLHIIAKDRIVICSNEREVGKTCITKENSTNTETTV